jgi:hypothetical protein
MSQANEKLLQQEIKDLPFTDDLKSILAFNKFQTLEDIVKVEVYNWHKNIPGFNYHHQHEIVTYLMNNDLGHFLKED